MNVVSYLLSRVGDQLLPALDHLQENSNEPLTVDWDKFALVCGHGVAVGLWSLSEKPTSDLGKLSPHANVRC